MYSCRLSACYPQRNFYRLIPVYSILQRGVTMPYLRICSTSKSFSQICFPPLYYSKAFIALLISIQFLAISCNNKTNLLSFIFILFFLYQRINNFCLYIIINNYNIIILLKSLDVLCYFFKDDRPSQTTNQSFIP